MFWAPFLIKGGNLSEIDRVIEVPLKVFNNKSCCSRNFGYAHKIAFCTAVQNLSQIGQPSFFTFSWGPPFENLRIFVYWHFMSKSKDLQRWDPMKKWKMKAVWFGSNFAQLYKMQFYAHSQNYSNFYYWKLSEGPLITLSISDRLPPF